MSNERQPLLEELRTVEDNCLYTAQAHFEIAARKAFGVRTVLVTASGAAAIAGGLVAAGLPGWIGIFSAIGGLVGTVSAAVGADKDVHDHLVAANSLTKLRQEVRAARETFSHGMTEPELTTETRRRTEAYNSMIQALPPTDQRAFERARKRIKKGRLHPDFREA